MIENMLTLHNVAKQREGFTLGPIDLQVESGYVVALVGPNGSGKSTLFRLCMNLLQPSEGEISLFGRSYREDEVGIGRQIGYVSDEEDWMIMGKTLEAIADYFRELHPGWDDRYYQELLAKFGLDPRAKVSRMSKGTRRKSAFVLALARRPRLLLLDEATAGVDPLAWRTMMDELTRFMETGEHSVILATHILEEVKRYADYIAFLYQGKLLGFYEKDDLQERWKTIWIDRPQYSEEMATLGKEPIPGVLQVDQERPVRLVTANAAETEAYLQDMGITGIRTQAMTLDEIFHHLVHSN